MDFRNKLECLTLATLSSRNLPEVLQSRVVSYPYPQTLDEAGKACQRQTLAYYGNP
jgi:hypothetical protein